MQIVGDLTQRHRLGRRLLGMVAAWLLVAGAAAAADRTTFLLPLPADAEAQSAPDALYADQAFGDADDGWRAYLRVWKAHHGQPDNVAIRRFLGLPLQQGMAFDARRGRTAPRWLGWRGGTFAQVDTPHFVIYSRAAEDPSRRVAEDLERCYWIWTQMFFPLWEGAAQVSTALASLPPEQPIAKFLEASSARITLRRKLQVVLFRDAREYQQTLGPQVPGIERSTGYYNDQRQTIFLYADETDDPATRRHELVHQLFREATRSGLGRTAPGAEEGFWLVEGIAGYFESLHLEPYLATVGGWDSPRLQYARYRVLSGGDSMLATELMADGQRAAQQRQDLARWYAHAIAHTHALLDGEDTSHRQWVYQQLAALYKIRVDLPSPATPVDWAADDSWQRSLHQYLTLRDRDLIDNPAGRRLQELCLTGCEITEEGLRSIPPSPDLTWLDLARLPIGNDAIQRLVPDPQGLQQLTLEVTRIDNGLLPWLSRADNLRELDLSWTPLGDEVLESLKGNDELTVMWMTGTKLTDRAIDLVAKMPKLQSLDVQRTGVSESGLARLRAARPELQINPLELRSP